MKCYYKVQLKIYSMFNWDNKYSVGVQSIDLQHQELFNFINKLLIYNYLIKLVLGFFIFFAFVSLTALYYIYDYFSNFSYLNSFNSNLIIYDNLTFNFLLNLNKLNLNLIYDYYFPFI